MKRLAVKVGEYEKNGETKGEYVRLGVIMTNNDGGEYLLLDPAVNLAGCLTRQNMMNHKKGKKTGDKLLCSVFSDQQQSQGQQQSAPAGDDFGDDIPFR